MCVCVCVYVTQKKYFQKQKQTFHAHMPEGKYNSTAELGPSTSKRNETFRGNTRLRPLVSGPLPRQV